MNRLPPQGLDARPRRGLRAALLVAGIAMAAGSVAAMTLRAAPAGDVIGQKRGQVRMLEAEVQRIDGRASAAADIHAAAVRRADDLRARIADTTRGLREARRARRIAVEGLSERIVGLYAQQPPSLIEVVLTSGGLTAAVDTQEALEAVGEQDQRIVERIQNTRERLTRLRSDLVEDRAGVEASVTTSATRLAELRRLIGSRRAVLDDAQGALDGLVVQDASRRRAAAAAEAAAERALLRRADPSTAPASAPAADPAASAATPTPAPDPVATADTASAAAAPSGDIATALARIAQCESGGNPRAVSSSGQYRGKYQFDLGTWQSLGGSGDPAAAPEGEQDRIAALLYARSGPAPWPICGYR